MKRAMMITSLTISVLMLTGQIVFAENESFTDKRNYSNKSQEEIIRHRAFSLSGYGNQKSKTDYSKKTISEKPASLGYNRSGIAYPTGRESTSAIYLEKRFPANVKVGQEFDYTIEVTNLTNLNLNGVSVNELIPANFEVISMVPEASSKSGKNTIWNIDSLDPNGSKLITIRGKASSKADLPCCTSADYSLPSLCHTTGVIQPGIEVTLNAQKESLVCDLIQLDYTVKNTGDSRLSNVTVTGDLPEGTTTSTGRKTLSSNVGNLNVGESRELVAYVRADDIGSYNFKVKATDGDVSASSSNQTTKVIQPKVSVTAKASKEKQFVGRDIGFEFDVKNASGVAAQSTTVVASIPSNARFISASDGGRASGNSVRWNIGTLNSFDSKNLSMELSSTSSGTAVSEVEVEATCSESANDLAKVVVSGIPALLLEVVDVVDPIEAGDEQTYKIRVTNQGTANANNVKIVANLDRMNHTANSGSSLGVVSGGKISFDAISKLGPKETASWTIKAIGDAAGDVRFKTNLTSEELKTPVEETESTFIY